jgi:hypothetical protein
MKRIVLLMGLGALLAVTGCCCGQRYQGGVYSDSYQSYGHASSYSAYGNAYGDSYVSYGNVVYPYDYDYSQWLHRDWPY